jgi:predicted RNA-binding Zn-ribbon protein involved in translation (DUF1610 family)
VSECQHYPTFCPICGESVNRGNILSIATFDSSDEDYHEWTCPNCGHFVIVKIGRHEED